MPSRTKGSRRSEIKALQTEKKGTKPKEQISFPLHKGTKSKQPIPSIRKGTKSKKVKLTTTPLSKETGEDDGFLERVPVRIEYFKFRPSDDPFSSGTKSKELITFPHHKGEDDDSSDSELIRVEYYKCESSDESYSSGSDVEPITSLPVFGEMKVPPGLYF